MQYYAMVIAYKFYNTIQLKASNIARTLIIIFKIVLVANSIIYIQIYNNIIYIISREYSIHDILLYNTVC